MIRVYTSNGKSSYGIAELLLDSEDDLTSLSETPDMGIFRYCNRNWRYLLL